MFIWNANEWVTFGKNVVTGLAAMVAAVAAWRGVDAWKTQLKGKANYDLARKFLISAYRVREAIRDVRRPMITVAEMAEARRAAGYTDGVPEANLTTRDDERLAYRLRWQGISAAMTEFDVNVLEGEVLWGGHVKVGADDLRKRVRELDFELWRWLTRDDSSTGLRETMRVVFDCSDPTTPDDFQKNLNDALTHIESIARKYLKEP